MTRQDPGAATGAGLYPPSGRCTCGDDALVHEWRESVGKRGACSNSGCGCPRFEAVETPDPTRCPTCGVSLHPLEVARLP